MTRPEPRTAPVRLSFLACSLMLFAAAYVMPVLVSPTHAQCSPDQTTEMDENGEEDDFDGIVGITQAGTTVTCIGTEERQVTTSFDPDFITLGPSNVTVNIVSGANVGSDAFVPVLLTGISNTINNDGTAVAGGDDLASLATIAPLGTINNAGTVVAGGTGVSGLFLEGNQPTATNNSGIGVTGVDIGGIETIGNNANVTNSGNITLNGSFGVGISAFGSGGMLKNPGTLFINSATSIGMAAVGSGVMVNNSGTLSTNAEQALGMGAIGSGVTVTNTATGTVLTQREQSHALFIGLQSVPALGLPPQVSDPASGTVTNDGMLTTEEDGSDGINGKVTSVTLNNNGSLTVEGDNSFGINIIGSSDATTISNAGTLTAGVETLPGISPTSNSGGIKLDGRGTISNAVGSTLRAFGQAAIGIVNTSADNSVVKNEGLLAVDSSISTAAGYGIDVAGNNVRVQNGQNLAPSQADASALELSGDNSFGIRTRGTSAIVSNSSTLSTVGDGNRAIDIEIQGNGNYWADNDGVINVGGGDNNIGMHVRNANPAANLRLDQASNGDAFCIAGGPTGAQILNCGSINLTVGNNGTAMLIEGTANSFIENQAQITGTGSGHSGIVINKAASAPNSDGQVNFVANFKSIDLNGGSSRGIQINGNGNLVFNGTGLTNFDFVPGFTTSIAQAIDRQTARTGPIGTSETEELTSLGMISVNGSGAIGIDVTGSGNLISNRLDFVEVQNPPPFDPNIDPENRPGFIGFSEIRATGSGSIGVKLGDGGNVFDNQGIVEGAAFSIQGGSGQDIVQNRNELIGDVSLEGGNDTFIQIGSSENIQGNVDAGEGGSNDRLTIIASTAPRSLEDQGLAQRTIIDGNQYQDFETLIVSNGAEERVNGPPVPAPPQARAFLQNELDLSAADGTGTSTALLKGVELNFEDDARLVADEITVGVGSALRGNGSIGRKVFNFGEVESTIIVDDGALFTPGNSPGIFELVGNVEFGGGLELEFAGLGEDEFDVFQVVGDLNLLETAAIDLIFTDGFAPKAGDTFDFLFAENLTGDLTQVAIGVSGLLDGFDFDLSLTGDGLRLTSMTDTVSTIPVPAAAWLFGSALLLLGRLRRR